MITISVKNPPAEAKFWNPTFYTFEDSAYTEVASAGQFLPIWIGWGTPLIGPSFNVDLMVDLFSTDQYPYTIVREYHTGFIDWLDNTNYVWNCETEELEIAGEAKKRWPWLLIGGGVAVIAAALIIPAAKRR